jgi:NADPH-dependent ferric siderophore reductase
MNVSEHTNHTASTKHTGATVTYLLTGDSINLAELEAAIVALPLCARGRVFVETDAAHEICTLTVPPRMTVTWLPRATPSGPCGTGSCCAPGEALHRAVSAWACEMLCDGADGTHVWLTGGYRGVFAITEHLVETYGVARESITTPAVFGLPTKH